MRYSIAWGSSVGCMQTRLKKQVSESPVPEVQKRDIRFMSQQLVLFKPVVVTGDRGNTYEVTMKPDHIYCVCVY